MKRMYDVFDVFTDDIFAHISSVTITDSDIASTLYFTHSGNKFISTYFSKMVEEKGKEYTMQRIGAMFDTKYGDNVKRLMLALAEEYNPIHNVEEHTTETIDKTNTRTDNLTDTTTRDLDGSRTTTATPDTTETQTYTAGITDERTRTPDLTHSVTADERTRDEAIYAFNSDAETPTPTDNSKETGTKTETETGSESEITSRSGEDVTTTHKTGEDVTTEEYADTIDETTSRIGTVDDVGQDKLVRERKGNIGVTSTQQLLSSEFEMRKKYNVFDIITGYLDDMLTIPIY